MLTLPDYVIIVLYLIGILALGLIVGTRLKTGRDFFLAGRQLPWWAVGMSLVATDIGGTDIIGVGGAAYRHGLAVANFEWVGCIPAMIVGAFVFLPYFYRSGVYTIPEFLEQRYNPSVRIVLATCWLIFMACNLGIMLLASGKMMAAVFGWDEMMCVVVTALLVGIYTCSGGLAAVVYTDSVQCVMMIVGCLTILVLGLIKVGGVTELQRRLAEVDSKRAGTVQSSSVEATKDSATKDSATKDSATTDSATTDSATTDSATTDVEYPRQSANPSPGRNTNRTALILPVDTATPFPWPGIYFGLMMILSPAYWIGNQAIVQRSLGARSVFEAKAAYVWGALLKTIIPMIIAVPGLIAYALLPDLADSDTAIPTLVRELLPVGLRGLFVAAFLAALMSSVDSYLNSAATIVSNDFYKRFYNADVSDQFLLRVGRITTAILVVWAIGFAMLMNRADSDSGIYAIFQTLMAFFQGPAFAILIIGILWKKATGRSALLGLLCGIGTAIGLYTLNQPLVYQWLNWQPLFQISDPYLYFSIWSFAVTASVLILGSKIEACLR